MGHMTSRPDQAVRLLLLVPLLLVVAACAVAGVGPTWRPPAVGPESSPAPGASGAVPPPSGSASAVPDVWAMPEAAPDDSQVTAAPWLLGASAFALLGGVTVAVVTWRLHAPCRDSRAVTPTP